MGNGWCFNGVLVGILILLDQEFQHRFIYFTFISSSILWHDNVQPRKPSRIEKTYGSVKIFFVRVYTVILLIFAD